MARTVKEEEYAVKRKEILDAAQRLVYTKGYEQMSIQDILNELTFPRARSTTTLIPKAICWKR